MKNKSAFLFVVLLFAASLQCVIAQDNSSTNPAAVGDPVRSMIELGSVYTNIYDITATTLEVVRGKEAMDKLKAAGAQNKPPADGFEYVLARVKFEFKGRAISDKISFDLGDSPIQWLALSGTDLTEYSPVVFPPSKAKPGASAKEAPASLVLPQPVLVKTINPGESAEGWVGFAVAANDAKPLMVFDPDTGGATGRGKTIFFKLYK